MKLADKLNAVKAKALEVGLRADYWNPIVLVITPPPDGEEEKQLLKGLEEKSDQPIPGGDRSEGRASGDGQSQGEGS